MNLLDEYKPKIKKKKRRNYLTPRQKGTNPRAKGTNPRNMKKKKSKAIVAGKSKHNCKQCGGEMVIKKHARITKKLRKQHYYFSQWDFCKRCNKVYFNEIYRVSNPSGEILDELNRQKSFLASI